MHALHWNKKRLKKFEKQFYQCYGNKVARVLNEEKQSFQFVRTFSVVQSSNKISN